MKKIMILAVVAALLGISAPNTSAQVPGSSQPSSTQQDDDDLNRESTTPSSPTTQPGTTESQPGTSGSQSGTSGSVGTSGSSTSTMSEYNEEVKSADLPAAITRSLNEKYPGYKTEKAFRAKDGTYKVKVSKGDEAQTLFFDERGESVKMHKK
jgi:hypothetical protein